MRECTEELGAPQTEEEKGDFPDIEEAITERNLDVVDMSKEPKLTLEEWNRLKACDRPCSKEEWRGMATSRKWETLGNLGFTHRGGAPGEARTSIQTSENTARAAPPPQSAKPPPPKPPSTYANDKRMEISSETAEKGTGKGKGKDKGKPKGKSSKGISTKGSRNPIQRQGDKENSEYTSYTARERNWGILKQKKEWGAMLE